MDEVQNLKLQLYQQLSAGLNHLSPGTPCSFVCYPNHHNIGDHAIWLGAVLYLVEQAKLNLKNILTIEDFQDDAIKDVIGSNPIIVNGGGNFGDVWSYYKRFYLKLVQSYPNNEIIFLPQTLYFRSESRREEMGQAFAEHPKITIFAREQVSLEIARKTFSKNRVLFALDTALALEGHINKSLFPQKSKQRQLYLCRSDGEYNTESSAASLGLATEDWLSYREKKRRSIKTFAGFVDLLKEWRSGEQLLSYFITRQWLRWRHPMAKQLKKLPAADLHLQSWNYVLMGVQQLSNCSFVVTNRLHAHILCCLLRIPHLFLANSYHKNQSFYFSNTSQIDFCRFSSSQTNISEEIAFFNLK